MPFKDVSVNDLRREFVQFAQQEGANISALCRRYGISRTHGYALLNQAAADGLESLDMQSRRPRTSPNQIAPELEAQIVAVRHKYPDWGARKIRAWLLAHERAAPAASTITTVLHRHQLIHPSSGDRSSASQRFEHAAPNDLWQMDFVGHKPMRTDRVHPFTIIDDHSRFGVTLAACADETIVTAWDHLVRCFERYGLPWAILCDNGTPWGHSGFGLTVFHVRLMQLGIQLLHGRPYHPQTQGKVERWHRTITSAVFGPIPFRDLEHAQVAFDAFLHSYNTDRPHEALDNDVPANRYHPSHRSMPATIDPPTYDEGSAVRKVRLSGEIHFQGYRWKVSRSLAGEWVAVQPTRIDGTFQVYYYNQRIRTLNLREANV